MSQTYDITKPIGGVTTFGELYQILRDHFAACATEFAGAAAPASPVAGRPWYDTVNARWKIYDGAAWQDSDYHTNIYTEVVAARGTASSLNARISAALAIDGTLSGTSPAGAWFTSSTTPWIYYSTVQFQENGDKTSVYTPGRAIYIPGSANTGFTYVTAAVYSGSTTTITLQDAFCDSSMTTPQFGQENFNYHYRMPWTRVLYSNSATSRDYAAANYTIISDGAGGVTVTPVINSITISASLKKYGSC